MKFISDYIADFESTEKQQNLAATLKSLKDAYDVTKGGDPISTFEDFVRAYNWLGQRETKAAYEINSNLARNLPGALMQDWLIHVMLTLTRNHHELMFFTEVRVPFGNYPVWESGNVLIKQPSEKSDLAVGYLRNPDGTVETNNSGWPNPIFISQAELAGRSVIPLVTVNSKIRVSQSEFFDWQGREQLMTKGNPHCLSIQVALRKEMDIAVVEASQAGEKFFLLGTGGETNVRPDRAELERFVEIIREHIERRMNSSPQQ
ncbi:hypothetical protein ACNFD4_10180 [Pseudomonas sp. NY15367]